MNRSFRLSQGLIRRGLRTLRNRFRNFNDMVDDLHSQARGQNSTR